MKHSDPKIMVITKYRILFLPFATYTKVGNVEQLTVFGLQVYGRLGNSSQYFGFLVVNHRSEE